MLKYIILFQLLCGNRHDSNAVKSELLCVIYCSILQHLKVEQSLPWESNSCLGIPKITCILWNPEVPYNVDTAHPWFLYWVHFFSSSFFLILSSSVWLHLFKRYSMHTRYNLLVDFYWEVMKENWRWLTNKFRYIFFFVYQPWFYYCHGQGHCATSRKVAGSIPDGIIGIFHWHNPSSCTMALGSTQPLTEMSTGNISWG